MSPWGKTSAPVWRMPTDGNYLAHLINSGSLPFGLSTESLDVPEQPCLKILTAPYVPFVFIVVYYLAVDFLRPSEKQVKLQKEKDAAQRKTGQRKPIAGLRLLGLIHDIALAAYSAYVAYNGLLIVRQTLARPSSQGSWTARFCQEIHESYDKGDYKFLLWTFYISKYYEIVDTLLLIANHKNPSTLQVFHHALAPLAMYLMLITGYTGSLCWVLFNGFIHFVMYSYYASCILGCKLPIPKAMITTMQMIQFAAGQLCYICILQEGCEKRDAQFCGHFNVAYITALLALFYSFYEDTYNKKSQKKNI